MDCGMDTLFLINNTYFSVDTNLRRNYNYCSQSQINLICLRDLNS